MSSYELLCNKGLVGLYRIGLFDPATCEYEGTFFQKAWESAAIPKLFLTEKGKKK